MDDSEYNKGIDDASGKASSFAEKLKNGLATAAKVGAAAIGAATTAVVAFAKSSIDAGSQFDAAMSQVAAVSGATGADFDALRDKAMEMGAKTKFSATESAEAFNYMAMAGWKTEDMLNGIEGIMNLAAASGEDLATTSDIVTDALTAFGLTAQDSAHFADVLAAASSNANTNVGMMGESFKYVAPLAGTLGYSAEDVGVALGLMANSGIKASQAGTSLRAALSSIIDPTDTVAQALTELGLSAEATDEFQGITDNLGMYNSLLLNSDGTTKSFMETMDTLRDAFSGLTESEQTYYATNLFGREAMSGMLAIINTSDEDFQKLTESIYSADGAAERMANTMQDNLSGDITKFKSALEGAQIVLSDKLTPVMRGFVQFGTDAVGKLTEAFQSGGLSGAMSAFGGILSDGIAMITESLPQMIDAGMQLLGALGQGIMDNIPTLAESAVEIVSMIANSILSAVPQLLETGGQLLGFIFDGIMTGLPLLAESAVTIMSNLGQYLRENLPMLLETGLTAIKELTGSIRENAGTIIDGAIALAKNLAQGLADSIPTIIENVPAIVSNIANTINDNAPKIFLAAIDIIGTLIKGLIDAIPTLVANMPKIIAAIWDTITAVNWVSLGSNVIKGLGNGLKSMISFVKDIGGQIMNAIKNGISQLPSQMIQIGKNIVQGVWNGIQSMLSWFTSQVKSFFTGIVNGVKNALGIHSPSKVFAGIGENMAAGLGKGWNDEYWKIKKDIEGGIDFGTANVDFTASGMGRMSGGIGAAVQGAVSGAGGALADIVINLTANLDGKPIYEGSYRYARNRERAYGVT